MGASGTRYILEALDFHVETSVKAFRQVTPNKNLGFRQLGGVLLGLVIGGGLIAFSFRKMDLGHMFAQWRNVPWTAHCVMLALVLAGLFFRGWRWWFTLPHAKRSEFWPAQRSLVVGYALNNVGPRIGEVARVYLLGKRTRRPYAQLASSVLLDRFVFDFMALFVFLGFAVWGARPLLEKMLPGYHNQFGLLAVALSIGLVGALVGVLFPGRVLGLLGHLGLKRVPKLWSIIERLFRQMMDGLSILGSPRKYPALLGLSVLIWASYLANFFYGLHLFGIHGATDQMLLVYTMTLLGMAVPSPGGIGTVHAFGQLALTSVMGIEPELGLLAITYIHGLNYIVLSLLGLIAFVWELMRPNDLERERIKHGSQVEAKNET